MLPSTVCRNSIGLLHLKGFSNPVAVYNVQGIRHEIKADTASQS
jgi:hypothetical protein